MCCTTLCINSIYRGVLKCSSPIKGVWSSSLDQAAKSCMLPLLKVKQAHFGKNNTAFMSKYIILSFVRASRTLNCHPWRETSPKYGQKCTFSIHPSFQITIFSTPNSGTHHDNFICCNAFTRVNLQHFVDLCFAQQCQFCMFHYFCNSHQSDLT